MTISDEHKLRNHLQRQLFQLADYEQQSTDWQKFVCVMILECFSALPQNTPMAGQGYLEISAPLIEMAKDPAHLVEQLFIYLECDSARESKLFQDIAERLFLNMLSANHITMQDYQANPRLMRLSVDDFMKTLSPAEVVEKLFAGTPLHQLLLTEVPLSVSEEIRFEHMHILAGTGHGKTQTLQHLIVQDLQRPTAEIPAMVILDSQGDMLNKLQRLALFDPTIEKSLARRLLIVDPSDVEFAPSLNLFDIQSERLKNYSQKDREQVLAGIIEIYDYIFGGLLGAELTQKQAMVFRFLAQLMLSIPGSTIHTLRDLLIDASPFMQYVALLPETARGFFEAQFFQHGYKATREQILRRLYGVLQNPSFERMFAGAENRLDLFDVLNEGGIVLVNTAKYFMKTESSSMFGRYIIALTFKAAMERAILPEQQRRPTFLWIDEASEYFDDKIDDLLIQARKYKLGLVMAHQYLGQLPKGLPASIMTNTSPVSTPKRNILLADGIWF
ncbi:MAG: type IV secretion system DNA-binding domain-containing protein [Hyphomicrobiaceae bacterium]|nr:type IV secretion system DNA-binding domain-containing protein [Hyphomicrobiaceae bacterium]